MPFPSEPDVLVLLGLRLASFGPSDVVAEAAGLTGSETAERLPVLAEAGLALHRDGRRPGWMLTPAGRAEGERRLADELDASGARDLVTDAYHRFLAVNQRLLDACTDWQLRDVDGAALVNDHTDADHDGQVVDELVAIDRAIQPVVSDLADALARMGGYGPRLTSALAKVQGGDPDWFTKPTIASYHTVWFELHENLLATLGIERGSEPPMPSQEASS
jgi:hypothetical protein